jgi:MraZ protein
VSKYVTKGQEVYRMSAMGHSESLQGVFVSSFKHSLDPKKRLTIPAEWREQVGDPSSLYVLPDVHHKCLCVFTASEMMHRIQSMREHGVADKKARFFARVLASQSDLVTWDSQGRIRIKDDLLAFANLSEQVVLVGAFDRFEIWNPDLYREASAMDGDSLRDAAQYVGF